MLIWYEHPEHGGPGCERMWKWGSSIDLIAKETESFFNFIKLQGDTSFGISAM